MEYSVLNPRGEADPVKTIGLQPRLSDLNNKTVGLFAWFKGHWVLILEEVARQLQARYPNIKFTRFQYTKNLDSYNQVAEIAKDPEVRPLFEEWLSGVDAVISANGDAGSCTLYLAYNTALVELLGKPVVMLLNSEFAGIAGRAVSLRGVPAMRLVEINIPELSNDRNIEPLLREFVPRRVSDALDGIIDALTAPLTLAEKNPPVEKEDTSRIIFKGSLSEVNRYFYKNGLSYGMPVLPPTEEAVEEMLKGTDLPPDHVVARIPPKMGKATVEKIAINAVMAGCLPTYMPVLIAAVEALVDPRMWLEAYTCSCASWAPLLIVNGPIRKDLNINSGAGVFSPYYKANAAIGHAVGLMVMNIGGIRHGVEDMGVFGHEGRFGMCIAEDEEESPWEPLHEFYGLHREDSAVTVFWPNTRALGLYGKDVGGILKGICDHIQVFGFDPGCAFIVCPETARLLQENGYSRKDFIAYIVEYARRPAGGTSASISDFNMRWMIDNQHIPKNVPLPAEGTRSVRKFFSSMHLPVVVAGLNFSQGVAMYGGGGDHGGPITKKIQLPQSWEALKKKYEEWNK